MLIWHERVNYSHGLTFIFFENFVCLRFLESEVSLNVQYYDFAAFGKKYFVFVGISGIGFIVEAEAHEGFIVLASDDEEYRCGA